MSELITATNRGIINRTPEVIAIEINSIKDQTKRILLASSIEIGRRLVEAKELVSHGEWEDWLEKSVDYSKSTAKNLMRIFQEYGSEQISLFGDVKSQALGDLSYTQAVALLGIPADEREQFVKENDIDNMSTRELQQAIKEREQALKDKEEAEKAAEAISKTLDNISKENEKLKKETVKEKEARLKAEREASELSRKIQEYKNQRESYLQQIDDFKAKLKEAEGQGDAEEVDKLNIMINALQDEFNKVRAEKEELEKQLKENPIETAEVIVEKVPEEIVKELQELRAKINQPAGNDKAVVKFSLQFDGLVKGFKELLGTLEEIQDIETKEKYKTAVRGLLGKMSERL
jgi:predicted  nucleic acid-binding Zn-ribbon protein